MGISVDSPLPPPPSLPLEGREVYNGVEVARRNGVPWVVQGELRARDTVVSTVSNGYFAQEPGRVTDLGNGRVSVFRTVAKPVEGDADEDGDSDDERAEWVIPEEPVYSVDGRDVGTADEWIHRHPELVRLTGRHPFNSEPPLSLLMQAGFITPTSLHYVRNHGYVPRGVWEEWTVEVTGLVKRPTTLKMQDLLELFQPRELPVTLVCAGNRRKEQNMVKQSIGFNWGAAACSTSIWRGARLCDVLRYCGVLPKKKGALFVCIEGSEILPGGGGSCYGTSITIEVAMDEGRDVLLAYEQNGKLLEPDHGFPVRVIIPGYIGGRMVKWLRKIVVTSQESGNYYHFHDNRVLPSHVDAEIAKAEGWWYRPDYVINELNINSAITTPAHAEVLPINFSTVQEPYLIKGYAYSGGGRKVTRVEISLDDGMTWRLCKIQHPEKPTKYGKYWCWCFWEVTVDVMELLQTKEIVVRAWDASMNTQPEHLTWNVMGMMNNCWFRVKVGPCKPMEGGVGLTFEHPTRPGNKGGGWMVKQSAEVTASNDVIAKSPSSPALHGAARRISMAEVRKHCKAASAWIVVHNKVYDCTKFLVDHPGGADSILINAGSDATEEFDAIHSSKAKAMLEEYYIGDLAVQGSLSNDVTPGSCVPGVAPVAPIQESESVRPVALSPKEKRPFRLIEKEALSHDVRRLRFALQSENHVLGLPVGKHIFVSATINGQLCMRAYTPTSNDDDVGYFELVIKVYFKDLNPRFPMGGLFSQYLDSLEIGDTIDVKGPVWTCPLSRKRKYFDQWKAQICAENQHACRCPPSKRKVYLASRPLWCRETISYDCFGGTGITPIYQVIRAVLNDPEDTTEVFLIYSNRTEADIMLRNQLDRWQENHKNFKVWYTLSGIPDQAGWSYSRGHINEEMVKAHLPHGSSDTVAVMCGPPALIESACLPNLEKLDYDKACCLQF